MKDYELSVLDQYDIEVSGTHKARGAILCDTNQGLLLLKESKLSNRRVPMMDRLYSHVETQGYHMIDKPLQNKDGNIISTMEDGGKYILKRWFTGRECDVKKEYEVLEAVKNLALLHNILVFSEPIHEFKVTNIKKEYLRHNRELKKARTFIRSKTTKGEFELNFLRCFDTMFHWANEVVEALEESKYDELYAQSIQTGRFVHGEYNYHNVLFTKEGTATTNFEHFYVDIQSADLYYFLRKVMEKHHWDLRLGEEMIEEYSRIRTLTKAEMDYIAIRLAYPEKFWKSANTYYNSNKAWIPVKSIEKLRISIEQIEEKKKFLKHIFAFHL